LCYPDTLSSDFSPTRTSSSSLSLPPNISFTTTAVAAALEPRSLPKGRSFWRERERLTDRTPSIFMTSMAAMPAQFQLGFLLSLPKASPEMWEMEIWPGWTLGSTERDTKSPRPSTAQPRKSKPRRQGEEEEKGRRRRRGGRGAALKEKRKEVRVFLFLFLSVFTVRHLGSC
jgi:hypothetical protein